MNQYTIYCTKEQALRAYMLGAPLEEEKPYAQIVEVGIAKGEFGQSVGVYKCIPTAEQMCGWIREKGVNAYACCTICRSYCGNLYDSVYGYRETKYFDKYEDALLAAIDLALDYLENKE